LIEHANLTDFLTKTSKSETAAPYSIKCAWEWFGLYYLDWSSIVYNRSSYRNNANKFNVLLK